MIGSKYLSELIDPRQFCPGVLNLIEAPTGCGKTYFALRYIPDLVQDAPHKVLFLIDSINGREQAIEKYGLRRDSTAWADDVCSGLSFFSEDNSIVAMTYARFGTLCIKKPGFESMFKYIICDEMHNLISYQNMPPHPNNHENAMSAIVSAIKSDNVIVLALTATPRKIILDVFDCNIHKIPVCQENLIRFEINDTKYFTNLKALIQSLSPNQTGICYARQIKKMIQCEQYAKNAGLSPICIWSVSNKDYLMNPEQLKARETILQEGKIPAQYNFLIINSSSETSIKIDSKVDYLIACCHSTDVQTQVRGRVNNDLPCLFLPAETYKDCGHSLIVPLEYMQRPLLREDKEQLCQVLNVKRPLKETYYKWPTIKYLLALEGYHLQDIRENNKRATIITENIT